MDTKTPGPALRRFGVLTALLVVVPIGYWARFSPALPEAVRDGSGGALYVVAAELALALIRPRTPPAWLAIAAFGATCAVEFLQLWHPAWLEAIRRTLPGKLILGTTFSWGDFPPYAVGAVFAWLLLRSLGRLV